MIGRVQRAFCWVQKAHYARLILSRTECALVVSVDAMEIDDPGRRAERALGAAVAVGDVVGAAPADQLVGVPVRAVVARRVLVAQREVGSVEHRVGARAAGGAAALPFEAAIAAGVEAVGRDAGLHLDPLVLEWI